MSSLIAPPKATTLDQATQKAYEAFNTAVERGLSEDNAQSVEYLKAAAELLKAITGAEREDRVSQRRAQREGRIAKIMGQKTGG